MHSRGSVLVMSLLLLTVLLLTASSLDMPAYSRQYGTSFTTCPMLPA
jgi:hypothetical protein